jgi:hypothetical protein
MIATSVLQTDREWTRTPIATTGSKALLLFDALVNFLGQRATESKHSRFEFAVSASPIFQFVRQFENRDALEDAL